MKDSDGDVKVFLMSLGLKGSQKGHLLPNEVVLQKLVVKYRLISFNPDSPKTSKILSAAVVWPLPKLRNHQC